MSDQMLTTVDNPYNPFNQFDQWLAWDMLAGYNTLGYLARIAHVSDDLSDADYSRAVDDAIDEILTENVYGMHCTIAPDGTAPRVPATAA